MIQIKQVSDSPYPCNHCGQENEIASVQIHSDTWEGRAAGWTHVMWLCVDCMAMLGANLLVIVRKMLKEQDGEETKQSGG